jgi:hypothetical protein
MALVSEGGPLSSRWLERLVVGTGLGYIATMQVFNPLRAATNDAALFAYGGQLILHGLVPYRDFWDNKPPAIFYTKAFGILLGGGHWLGPTILQGVVLVLTVALLWHAARVTFTNPLPRYFTFALATIGLGNPFVVEGAHLTETYQVLPLIGTFCLLRPFDRDVPAARWVLAGATSAIAFLYKPSGAAIGVVAVVAVALNVARLRWSPRRGLWQLASYSAGGAAVLVLVTLCFAMAGSARDFWFATLEYNVTAYRELFPPPPSGWLDRLRPLVEGGVVLRGLLAGALGSIVAIVIRFGTVRDLDLEDRVVLAATWALADLSFAFATGYAYPHYFVPLSLSLAFAAAPLFAIRFERSRVSVLVAVIAVVVGVSIVRELNAWRVDVARTFPSPRRAFTTPSTHEKLATALKPYLQPGEPILSWGHQHGPQVFLGRAPMVGLLSSLHLGSGYGLARWSAQYEAALAKRPPVIIDTVPMFLIEGAKAKKATWIRPLADRFEEVLRVEYVRLPFEPRDDQAFVRLDRWKEIVNRRSHASARVAEE